MAPRAGQCRSLLGYTLNCALHQDRCGGRAGRWATCGSGENQPGGRSGFTRKGDRKPKRKYIYKPFVTRDETLALHRARTRGDITKIKGVYQALTLSSSGRKKARGEVGGVGSTLIWSNHTECLFWPTRSSPGRQVVLPFSTIFNLFIIIVLVSRTSANPTSGPQLCD